MQLVLITYHLDRDEKDKFFIEGMIAEQYTKAIKHPPDWDYILRLYSRLEQIHPTPVLFLNRAVILLQLKKYDLALMELGKFKSKQQSQLLHSVKGEILVGMGRAEDAFKEYSTALGLAKTESQRELIKSKIAKLEEGAVKKPIQ